MEDDTKKLQVLSSITAMKKLCNHPKVTVCFWRLDPSSSNAARHLSLGLAPLSNGCLLQHQESRQESRQTLKRVPLSLLPLPGSSN